MDEERPTVNHKGMRLLRALLFVGICTVSSWWHCLHVKCMCGGYMCYL